VRETTCKSFFWWLFLIFCEDFINMTHGMFYVGLPVNSKTKFTLILLLAFLVTTLTAPVIAEPLTVKDQSENTYNFTIEQLMEMPPTTEYAELYCYGNLLTRGTWTGIQLSVLLDKINIGPDVASVQFEAQDKYTITIPITLANAPQTIIAYQRDGAPLAEGLRLILPGFNGASWIAQIVSISTSSNLVLAPASISVAGSEFNRVRSLGTLATATPTPTPTPKSTINDTTPSPTAPIQNSTDVEPPLQQTTADQQSFGFDQIALVLAATLIAILAAAAGVYIRKNRRLER
jgi:hypothetical protein